MQYEYPCVLAAENDGGFSVSFPDVPEALTCGGSRAEALALAGEALAVALGAYMNSRESVPSPSRATRNQELVAVPPIAAAKLALYNAMRREGLTMAALAGRLGLSEGAVRKLLNPDHRSHISQIEKALRVVGRGLVIGDRAA